MKTKIVKSLPTDRETQTFYAVKTQDGFELYLTDDTGKAKKLNFRNLESDNLKIPSNTIRTLDVTDARFKLKGLRTISSDNSFNKKLKVNDLGEVVSTIEPDLTVNIPELIQVQSKDMTYANLVTTLEKAKVFHLIDGDFNANRNLSIYDKYMKTITEDMYHRVNSGSEWTKISNTGFENGIEWNDDLKAIEYKAIPNLNVKGSISNYNMILNKPLPMNKNWVLSFEINPFRSESNDIRSNFPTMGFLRDIVKIPIVAEIARVQGNSGSTGIVLIDRGIDVGIENPLTVVFVKVDKTICINVSMSDKSLKSMSVDISNVTEENIYFTATGRGTSTDHISFNPKIAGVKYYIDDRELHFDDRVDSEANQAKLKEFKKKVSGITLTHLTKNDWFIEKAYKDIENKSVVTDVNVTMFTNKTNPTNSLSAISFTPNFKLPHDKNYYFKWEADFVIQDPNYWRSVFGLTSSLKGLPTFGQITNSSGGTIKIADSQNAPTNITTYEIWKIDNIVNIRISQGVKEYYNVIFDSDLCGDLYPSTAVIRGDRGLSMINHSFGEYYIEE